MVALAAEVRIDLLAHVDRLDDPVFAAFAAESIEAAHRLAEVREKQSKRRKG